MIGLVLAAGAGRRLLPLTEELPKTLLAVDGEETILDLALDNLARAGISEVALVTGHRAGEIHRRLPVLERRHDLDLETVSNDRAEDWNNAYSLWLARERFRGGAVLVNGDTVFPDSVIPELVERLGDADVLLAIDDVKALAEEEMKVGLDESGRLRRISKLLPPGEAVGEYIGVAALSARGAGALSGALEAVWRRDPSLYYEDGFQELVDRGGRVEVQSIGAVPWVEVDDHTDLARARELRCHS